MTDAERLQRHLSTGRSASGWGTVPPVVCKNGFTMSVQASAMHYCEPKSDLGPWTAVEVGYPSKRVRALAPYRESYSRLRRPPLTDSVYPYVPVDVVLKVIADNGGMH